ncbi:hypothetical protein AGMMS50218_11230 [Actinomycetota bacterium]|nr:hypothetical protein AGMMS50218_11230 [Actinomycetota bacterium]
MRIRDVPVTPSSEANAWSSGRRSALIAAPRVEPPEDVLTADSVVFVTKDPSPSSEAGTLDRVTACVRLSGETGSLVEPPALRTATSAREGLDVPGSSSGALVEAV